MDDQTVERSDSPASHDSPPSEKNNGRTSLLESGEDFEVLDDDDTGDDLPPLEDTGGGKGRNKNEHENQKSDVVMEPPHPVDEWLDVLGIIAISQQQMTSLALCSLRPQNVIHVSVIR